MERVDFLRFIHDGPQQVDKETAMRLSEENRVNTYNATVGMDDGTGVECRACLNKGVIAFVSNETGRFTTKECAACAGHRRTVNRLKAVGVWKQAQRCTFANFKTDTPTQAAMLKAAKDFVAANDGHWLVFCGQSGSGKTHLCTATFVQLSSRYGYAGQYFLWNSDGRRLKGSMLDDEAGLWDKYKKAQLLYIDDLLKGGEPSGADIRLAFEILDYRYNNRLTTIISSEMPFSKLDQTDQAIAGRIREMCGPYLVDIAPDRGKNYRYRAV